MLKFYANTFRFDETTLTRRKLNILKGLTALSLPLWPLYLTGMFGPFDLASDLWVMFGVIISGVALAALMFTRVVNRFWARDKYLDEWEVEMKHASMAFAFQFVCYVLAIAYAGVFAFGVFGGEVTPYLPVAESMVTVLLLGLYGQIFYVLFKLDAIDRDEPASTPA
jgi:hypothetical protein